MVWIYSLKLCIIIFTFDITVIKVELLSGSEKNVLVRPSFLHNLNGIAHVFFGSWGLKPQEITTDCNMMVIFKLKTLI